MLADLIDQYLGNKIYDRVIVSGLDHSGKTFTLRSLVNKYDYIKGNKYTTWCIDPRSLVTTHKLFDRCALTDSHIYEDLDKDDSELDFDSIHKIIKHFIDKYYSNTLFILFLHDKFLRLEDNEPEYVYKYRDKIKHRYELLSKFLISEGYSVIEVRENSFRGFNLYGKAI